MTQRVPFSHALQLRQAKLSFPSTRLLVGVCSDELVRDHKANTIMNHKERCVTTTLTLYYPLRSLRRGRCENVRHCKWADDVIPEAPWIITPEFLEKHKIDYVAHDEDPYVAVGLDDIYGPVKREGSSCLLYSIFYANNRRQANSFQPDALLEFPPLTLSPGWFRNIDPEISTPS